MLSPDSQGCSVLFSLQRLGPSDTWHTKLLGLALASTGLIGFGFAVAESSPEFCSCPLFHTGFGFLEGSETKWLKWLRENMDRFMMFNKRSKLFHSSLEKLPVVRKSASWFLESTYLIWILGSRLILSKDQSRATLWVLVTCLTVGLLPLMIILITASLSSEMCKLESAWEECVLLGTWSTRFNWSISDLT